MAMQMEIDFGALTDTGCVRENNEDAYGLAPEVNLFVLSDGMGGLAFGEVASRLAVDAVLAHCREAEANVSLPLSGERIDGVSATSNRLASAIRLANEAVHHAALQSQARQQMGATVVAVQFDGERMSLAHVGDSRAYRLRDSDFEQLTQDHSFVAEQMRRGRMTQQEAGSSTLQNVLVRALGIDPLVEVDVGEELVMEGDTVLLCSDGLTRELSDAQIAAVLGETEDAQEAAGRLIDLAKQAGGGDNITAIVLRHAAKPVGAFARIGRLGKWFKGSRDSS
jgi:serine/threonine protein phosphatase PrpC